MICYMHLYVFLISSQQDRLAELPTLGVCGRNVNAEKCRPGFLVLDVIAFSTAGRRFAQSSSGCLQDAQAERQAYRWIQLTDDIRCISTLEGRAKTQIYTDLIWSYESYMIKLWWICNSLKGGWVCIFVEGLDTLGSRVLRQLALHCHCCHAEGQR